MDKVFATIGVIGGVVLYAVGYALSVAFATWVVKTVWFW